MTDSRLVCQLAELQDPGSRGFSIEVDGELIEGFVVQQGGQVFGYRNQCPHTGSPLDWVEHQFLDLDQAFIQCAVHDARFDIASGECIAGPCVGDFLQPLPIEVQDDQVLLAIDD